MDERFIYRNTQLRQIFIHHRCWLTFGFVYWPQKENNSQVGVCQRALVLSYPRKNMLRKQMVFFGDGNFLDCNVSNRYIEKRRRQWAILSPLLKFMLWCNDAVGLNNLSLAEFRKMRRRDLLNVIAEDLKLSLIPTED